MKRNTILLLLALALLMAIALAYLWTKDEPGDAGPVETEAPVAEEEAPPTDSETADQGMEDGEQGATMSRTLLAERLAEAARQINAEAPIAIDAMTSLTAAESSANRITYRYEVSRQLSAPQVARFRELAGSDTRRAICAREETRALIDDGGEIEYAYFGPSDAYLFSTTITDC